MDFNRDYYKILELNKSASKEQIKASYRRLAKRYHPDKNPGEQFVEEKFKLVNEAYEILGNDITRHVYDEYKKREEILEQEAQKTEQLHEQNKKTYYRTETIRKEKRIYLKGRITVKFWGEQLQEDSYLQGREVNYTIHPTDAEVLIQETDIHPLDHIPSPYQKSFKESELFKTPLLQPIKCIVRTSQGEEHYHLQIHEIRVKEPKITNVTKHDGESFGTLDGEFYGYTLEVEIEEVQLPVTECFGATGRQETKQEGGATYVRKEYYYKDCTTYWAPWEKIIQAAPANASTANNASSNNQGCFTQTTGCLQWWWTPLLLLFLIKVPAFFLALLGIFLLAIVLNLLAGLFSLFGRLLSWLALLFLVLITIAAIRSCSSTRHPYIKHDRPNYDTLSTSTVPLQPTATGDTTSVSDTLISHFIRWKDYDSTSYEAVLSIRTSDLRSSSLAHNQLIDPEPNTLTPVYSFLGKMDEPKLSRIYNAFDSIGQTRNLDEPTFAKMIVSCIQSIPFYLVVDRSCTDSYYNDDYIQNYLASCNSDCCIGYEKYGVRSPVEFLSDLKGDCDTRSLLIYTILKHYNYDVTLLVSNYYKHALIAVHFKTITGVEGSSISIHNRNYYLWETTSAGFNVGIIPPDIQNLDYWEVALLNQNEIYASHSQF